MIKYLTLTESNNWKFESFIKPGGSKRYVKHLRRRTNSYIFWERL